MQQLLRERRESGSSAVVPVHNCKGIFCVALMDEKTRRRRRLWRLLLLLPLNLVASNESLSRFQYAYFHFFSLEHSMNLMSLKLNNNRHTKTLKNCHCLGLSSVVVVEASTASAFIWSSHPSRQLKISHYLECYHFKNLIMGMPKTGHNFVYRNRVCSQLYRGCGHSLSSLPLSGSSEKKDYTTTIPIYYYTRRLYFFSFFLSFQVPTLSIRLRNVVPYFFLVLSATSHVCSNADKFLWCMPSFSKNKFL